VRISRAGAAGLLAAGAVAGGGAALAAKPATSPSPLSARNGTSLAPRFWPIGVWLQDPTVNAVNFRNIKVNTFIGLWQGPTEAQLSALASAGMSAFAAQNTTGLTSPNNRVIKAWMQVDEPDDAQWNGTSYDPCIDPTVIQRRYSAMKASDPTRPVYLNLGRGVADTGWGGRGSCTGRTDMYPEYAKGADILSFDVYPVNDGLPLVYVANGVDNLRAWGGGKPVYGFIETTAINGGTGPTTAQIKAETWLAIVHGATGTEYFCHVFQPVFVEAGCLAPAIASALNAQNTQIVGLTSVLNTATVTGTSVSSQQRVDQITKRYAGATYVFAVNTTQNTAKASFTLAGVRNGTAVVLGEGRSIRVSSGRFSDTFTGYATHLYRIN
jgi:hypothetical protein